VWFSSPAPSLPPRYATQSVTPKQTVRTRSRTTVMHSPPAHSMLTAASPGSIMQHGSTTVASIAAGPGGRSSWHAGMLPPASPFAAADIDRPPAEMRYSVRHSLTDADERPPLPAAAAAAVGVRATSRSCTDVMLQAVPPRRSSSSAGGTGVSTNCLFEPVPPSHLEQLPPALLHSGRESSSGDAVCFSQQTSSSRLPDRDCYILSGDIAAAAAAAAAETAAGTPRVTRASSSGGSHAVAADAAGSSRGVPGQRQLCILLGGALDSLANLQGALQEGQAAADALLGR
jgi:hypothetical protein